MTPREAEALAFIREYIAKHGHSPSYENIQTALGYHSKSNASRLVHGLVKLNKLRIVKGKRRSLELVPDPVCTCPACGAQHDIAVAA